jgi:hypothetical protein
VQSGLAALMRGPVVYCLDPAKNPSLPKFDVSFLKSLALDPRTVTDLPNGDPLGGMACRVQAFNEVTDQSYWLTLTQFPNPGGVNVYFHLTDMSVAAPDELVGMFQVPEPGTAALLTGCLGAVGLRMARQRFHALPREKRHAASAHGARQRYRLQRSK